MDAVTDSRLQQQFHFDNTNFAFPTHAGDPGATGQYDPSAIPYGTPGGRRENEQDAWSSNNGIQSHINGNLNATASSHTSPRARLRASRNDQQSPLNGRARPIPQHPSSPQQRSDSRSSGLVFKNSSSNYPQGAPVSSNDTVTENSAIYLPLDQTPNSNVNYFSSDASGAPVPLDPELEQVPLDPGSAGPSANPFSDTFPLVTDPPNLEQWRARLFNIEQPIHLTEAQFLTYFPHIDNVYSHRSTQKYKRKPFVSHYWDCRLKGRPSGTKKSDDPNKKKRKREKRERDLCDVKIKVTEWFGEDQCRELGIEPEYPKVDGAGADGLQIVMESANTSNELNAEAGGNAFGMLEPSRKFPRGHPGADGKRWYTVLRVNGSAHSNAATGIMEDEEAGDGDDKDLDHKHGLDESDRIKKNSVQRFLLNQEKERRATKKVRPLPTPPDAQQALQADVVDTQLLIHATQGKADGNTPSAASTTSTSFYRATGLAQQTASAHGSHVTTHLTFFGNAYCPFAQRIWIALELKGIPYQYVECIPPHIVSPPPPKPDALLEVNPDGNIPCIRHGNWGIWESSVMMEYLEELEGGAPLLPRGRGTAQIRAHCRLWVDHVERRVLPAFYAVLLMPPPRDGEETSQTENRSILMNTLQAAITKLVNASHAIGPYFLGDAISYVDVAFAPWIIRLSRVLERYRGWPRPEVGTRWQSWVNAVECDDRVRRTVSKDESYHGVYKSVGEAGWDSSSWVNDRKKSMVEMAYARMVIRREGFGLGGDLYGQLGADPKP